MDILLNDAPISLPEGSTLADAIAATAIAPPYAAAVNGGFVPKTHHASHPLQSGDKIDLVQPVVGG
jgi:sulfur carrier protein